MSQEIHKKVFKEYFESIVSGEKTFELRLADWECKPGDTLVLHEIDSQTKEATGRTVQKTVGYILKTKNLDLFPAQDVDTYGYQVISLLDGAAR